MFADGWCLGEDGGDGLRVRSILIRGCGDLLRVITLVIVLLRLFVAVVVVIELDLELSV